MFQLIISFPIQAVLCQTWGFYESFWVKKKTLYHVSDYINCHIAMHLSTLYNTGQYQFLWPTITLTAISIPSYPHYSNMVYASTALALHLTACLPRVGWPIMGSGHRYSNCWIGHFCLQAWPAWSPYLTYLYYLWDGEGTWRMVCQQKLQTIRAVAVNHGVRWLH